MQLAKDRPIMIIKLCGNLKCGKEQKKQSLKLILSIKRLKELKKSQCNGNKKSRKGKRHFPIQ